jgi:hypothetical protein
MKPNDLVKGKSPPWLVGKRLKVQSVCKRTGMVTAELLEDAASFRSGSILNLMPHEVEKSK